MSSSQAKKQVDWCLKKAEKELATGNKHRGLVQSRPDGALARRHLAKAEHNLEVLLDNRRLGHYDWTIAIGFYTMYHCCLSLLALFGLESRNQTCTLAAIENLIEEGKIDKSFERYIEVLQSDANDEGEILHLRETYQYTPIVEIDRQKVEELLGLCQDMLKETKGIVLG